MTYLIHHFLEKSSDINPDKEAVVHGIHRYSYMDVEEKANRIANWLISAGVKKGDRIAILLRNSVDYISSYYGILKTGAITVPLNTGIDAKEMGQMLTNCSAGILISESHFFKHIEKICMQHPDLLNFIAIADDKPGLDKTGIKLFYLSDIYDKFQSYRPNIKIIDQDFSSIIYTSGSTGKPKGVTLTHLNVVTNTNSIISYLRLNSDDRCMVILPFYYVYGKSLLNTHFKVSGTIVIDNRFTFPNAVLKTMNEEKVTGFSGVPSTYSILLNRSAIAKTKFPYLRYLTQAGGHMYAELKKRLLSIFPDKKIYIMYGATEASARLAYLSPEELPSRLNSIGKAIPNVEIRILKNDGTQAEAGEEGEIAARGSNIMSGYWNLPEESSKVLKDGWYYTGDMGVCDEQGFISVTGRKRDMIKIGIYKVSANEIEEVLHKYPGVQEAAVVGTSDEIQGEAAVGFIVINSEYDKNEKDILKFCSEFLPAYKIPREIRFIEKLPKNESGKVLKQKLSDIF